MAPLTVNTTAVPRFSAQETADHLPATRKISPVRRNKQNRDLKRIDFAKIRKKIKHLHSFCPTVLFYQIYQHEIQEKVEKAMLALTRRKFFQASGHGFRQFSAQFHPCFITPTCRNPGQKPQRGSFNLTPWLSFGINTLVGICIRLRVRYRMPHKHHISIYTNPTH